MRQDVLLRHFESIGARAKIRNLELESNRFRRTDPASYELDVRSDRRGSYFDIALGPEAPDIEVLQAVPRERHLLLFSRDGQRFLCGHDERDWFIAAVGERVSTVRAARGALLPAELRESAAAVSPRTISRRHNRLFKRQGEWFFVPSDREIPEGETLRNEPLQRTPDSKPHVCEELYREGGEVVYIVWGRAYNEDELRARSAESDRFARAARSSTTSRLRNPEIYARGAIRHPDHATLHLSSWHRVYINGEVTVNTTAVTFLD